jgi:hypothetical protein
MDENVGPMDEALLKRLSEAICDVSGSAATGANQLEGVVRMLSETPARSDGPPRASDDYQR